MRRPFEQPRYQLIIRIDRLEPAADVVILWCAANTARECDRFLWTIINCQLTRSISSYDSRFAYKSCRLLIEAGIPRDLSLWSRDRNGGIGIIVSLHSWAVVISSIREIRFVFRFQLFRRFARNLSIIFSKLRAGELPNRTVDIRENRWCIDRSLIIARVFRGIYACKMCVYAYIQRVYQYRILITLFGALLNWPSTRLYLLRNIRSMPFPCVYCWFVKTLR